MPREVSIPFDQRVWFRGQTGVSYKADVLYPWRNEWPETFVSGKPIKVTIPPFTVLVMQLAPGAAQRKSPGMAQPLL